MELVKDLEEAELNAYMDSDNAKDQGPTEEDRVAYLTRRHEDVKTEYKLLQLQKEEIEGRKDDALLANLHRAFGSNYKARKFVVQELRKAGEHVVDPFIPNVI